MRGQSKMLVDFAWALIIGVLLCGAVGWLAKKNEVVVKAALVSAMVLASFFSFWIYLSSTGRAEGTVVRRGYFDHETGAQRTDYTFTVEGVRYYGVCGGAKDDDYVDVAYQRRRPHVNHVRGDGPPKMGAMCLLFAVVGFAMLRGSFPLKGIIENMRRSMEAKQEGSK